LVAIGAVWLAIILQLTVAALGRHRTSTKLGALSGLLIVLSAGWLLIVIALGDLAAHSDFASWPSPTMLAGVFFLAFAAVAAAAFTRMPH
jgi:hypothetical protein